MRVLTEILFARVAGRDLCFQVARLDLTRSRGDPDVSAREFAETRLGEPDALRVVHSTSWRYERGRIVLSYLVYSDRLTFRGRPRRARLDAPAPRLSRGAGPARISSKVERYDASGAATASPRGGGPHPSYLTRRGMTD